MSEEDFDKKLVHLEEQVIDVIDGNLDRIYMTVKDLKSEIKAERAELEDRLVKAEAKLKIYEAMFEKLNLNINLNQRGEEEE